MQLTILNRLLKFKRTLFGLPFTLSGALLALACDEFTPVHWSVAPLILLAFFAARSAGMAFNELIDRSIDAANPRTASRVLPSNAMAPRTVFAIGAASLLLLFAACYGISPKVFALSSLGALLIVLYSYTKRVTALCHFVLGAVHLLGPLMAWLAVGGGWGLAPLLLGGAAALYIAGNDIIYAIQDVEFDKGWALKSLPVTLGIEGSFILVRTLHACASLLLISLGVILALPIIYYVGIACALGLNLRRHLRLSRGMQEGLTEQIVKSNLELSLSTLASILLVLVWRVLS